MVPFNPGTNRLQQQHWLTPHTSLGPYCFVYFGKDKHMHARAFPAQQHFKTTTTMTKKTTRKNKDYKMTNTVAKYQSYPSTKQNLNQIINE